MVANSGQTIFCRIGFDCAVFEKAFGIVLVLARTVPFLFLRVKRQMASSGYVENNTRITFEMTVFCVL